VNLEHGFRIEAISEYEAIRLVSTLVRHYTVSEARDELTSDFPCWNREERRFYVINGFFAGKRLHEGATNALKFHEDLVVGYLKPTIRLMRLFKAGDIRLPLAYYYFVENKEPILALYHREDENISEEQYKIESSELPELQRFIQKTKLPFEKSFLQLAFENLELTYQINMHEHAHAINLIFLALMTSLEGLLNPGEHELRYRISRNAAVLLGRGRDNSEKIFREIKNLYDKRSEVVHTGKLGVINEEDLLKLRHYVRESIKKISAMGKNKEEILGMLNSCGFNKEPD
jgi:hypothetical protein